MKKKSSSLKFHFQSFFTDLKFSLLFAGGVFLFLFISISSFAALNKDTLGPNGSLTGGTFMYWMQEILVKDSLPVENNLFSGNTRLENPTVQKTRRLANADGSIIGIGKDGKLGIGIENPSSLVEISGNTPRVLISSLIENPQLKLVAKNSDSGIITFDASSRQLIFQKGGENVLSLDENGRANTNGEVRENNVVIVKADQKCEQGFFVKGFDEQGNIKCGV